MSGSENALNADKVSFSEIEAKAPSNALDEVLEFCSQTVQHPEARLRQTGTVLQGFFVGGIKDIPNEVINHPLETCSKVVVAGGIGIAAGAALALEIPIVTGITIGTGVTMLGVGIYDSFKRMSSNSQLQGALRNVWKDEDFYAQMQANDKAEKILGPEAFNWGVTLPAGLVGGFGGNIATKMVAAKLLSGKPAVVPVDTPEVIQIPAESTVTKAPTGSEQTPSGNAISTDNAITKKTDTSPNDQPSGGSQTKYWEAPGWKNPDYIDFHNPMISAYRAAKGDTAAMETPRYKYYVELQQRKFDNLYRCKDEPVEIEPFKIDPKLLEALERALGNEPDPDIPMSDI